MTKLKSDEIRKIYFTPKEIAQRFSMDVMDVKRIIGILERRQQINVNKNRKGGPGRGYKIKLHVDCIDRIAIFMKNRGTLITD
jgi:transcription initiation factor IIE alpha subunit